MALVPGNSAPASVDFLTGWIVPVARSSVIPLVGDHYHLKGRLRYITQTYGLGHYCIHDLQPWDGMALAYPAIVIY